MSDLSRRNFLFGTVASAAAGALILRPETNVVRLFKPTLGETLALSRVPTPDPKRSTDPFGVGEVLYAADGTAVLWVREYKINAAVDGPLDITAFGDVHREFIDSRIKRYEMDIRGYPSYYWR